MFGSLQSLFFSHFVLAFAGEIADTDTDTDTDIPTLKLEGALFDELGSHLLLNTTSWLPEEYAHYFRYLFKALPAPVYAHFIALNPSYFDTVIEKFYAFFPSNHRELQLQQARDYFDSHQLCGTFLSLGASLAKDERQFALEYPGVAVLSVDLIDNIPDVFTWSGRGPILGVSSGSVDLATTSCVLFNISEVPYIVHALLSACKNGGEIRMYEPQGAESMPGFREAMNLLRLYQNQATHPFLSVHRVHFTHSHCMYTHSNLGPCQ